METEKPITIVITEDKELYRKTISEALETYNIQTIAEASNGKELIDCLNFKTPDVALLDLQMPVMDGTDTLHWLKQNRPNQKVIILSHHDEALLFEDFKRMGASGYLVKDESLDNMVWAIKLVHRGGLYFPPSQNANLKFSSTQKEIIVRVANGKTQVEIARELGLTTNGVYKQLQKIMESLGINNLNLLQRAIIERGLHFLRWPKSRL